MSREDPQRTKITLRSDRAVAIASRLHGANIAAIGFNLEFIGRRDPTLAADLLRLWKRASQLHVDDPDAHDEDYAMVEAALRPFVPPADK